MGHTDSRYFPRGLSRDGCAYVLKEIQRHLEAASALAPPILSMDEAADRLASPGYISPDTVVILKCDITEFFHSCNRQHFLDVLTGVASCDYPHTDIRAGDPMPMHPCFKQLLHLAVGLYGQRSTVACHHHSRLVALVPFTTGVSQWGTALARLLQAFQLTLLQLPP